MCASGSASPRPSQRPPEARFQLAQLGEQHGPLDFRAKRCGGGVIAVSW
jgi:hypothetical protein